MTIYSANVLPQLQPRFTPNTDDAHCRENNSSEVLGVTGAFCALALVVVILRLYVRTKILKFVGADDYAMVAATAMAIGTFVCFVGESNYGVGRHVSCIRPEDLEAVLHWQFYHSIGVMFGVVFVKISIAFFLMRLAPKPLWKRCLYGAIIFLTCFALACAGTLIFSCLPVSASWDLSLQKLPTTKCFSNETYAGIGLFNSVINICTDFLFAILPIPIIFKLQVSRRTKITLIFILALGFVACSAGIIKAQTQETFLDNPDRLWHDGFMVWNMLELCLGILAASLPSLRPLFSKLLATTSATLGRSGPDSKTPTPRAFPGVSQSSGYRRQHDPYGMDHILDDVDLKTYPHTATATVESRAEANPEAALTRAKRPFNVRVTGDYDGSSDEGQDVSISRGDSEERLHPPPGIYKRLEITRTSEVMRR